VVIIKGSINHFKFKKYWKLHIQATQWCLNLMSMMGKMTLQSRLFMKINSPIFFGKLGNRFIVGGDYNAKHTHWGSRLITEKGCVLIKAANNEINAEMIFTRKPTYWPTDQNKILNLLVFFVVKNISFNYVEVEGLM